MSPVQWEDLPLQVRQAVTEQTGTVVKTEPICEGVNSQITLIAHTRHDRVFIKGVQTGDARRVRSLTREAAISSYVTAVSPALLWQVHQDDWMLLGFEYIDGRRVDYSPASPDLPLVLETLEALAGTAAPALTPPLPTLEARMANYTPPDHLWRFAGEALLHTDWNPGNVRISGKRAWLVDWAVPTRGVAWSDAADVGLCLITCGHTPHDAEAILAELPVWNDADPEAVRVSVLSAEATWASLYPQATDDPWINATVQAARRWAEHHRGAP
ncbi:hypothetical protein ACFVH6_11345 [Spirillospora sp. NPDC127200]